MNTRLQHYTHSLSMFNPAVNLLVRIAQVRSILSEASSMSDYCIAPAPRLSFSPPTNPTDVFKHPNSKAWVYPLSHIITRSIESIAEPVQVIEAEDLPTNMLSEPTSITCNPTTGFLYVVNYGTHRISIFDMDLQPRGELIIYLPGSTDPLDCDSIAFSDKGLVAIGTWGHPEVSLFNSDMSHRCTFREEKWGHVRTSHASSKRMVFDDSGVLYLADPGTVSFFRYNSNGKCLAMVFDGYLAQQYGIRPIHGLTINQDREILFLERYGYRVSIYSRTFTRRGEMQIERADAENNLFPGPKHIFGVCSYAPGSILFYDTLESDCKLKINHPYASSAVFGLDGRLYVVSKKKNSLTVY
eukprot:TRINITY_DN6721_c0_g1_i4.p1 TRINITY_DN6721_c0_g1~~TRINITY_DN6721_c0_g1_i4.p1  ORF type:complete len:356 (+),score=61.98 TRINITY_DN6721_c0_g1_i4:509-1576(+)